MRAERLTQALRLALEQASSIAADHDNPAIEPVHVMKALLDEPGGSSGHLLISLGVDVLGLQVELNRDIDDLPHIVSGPADQQMSNDLMRLLNRADKYAQYRKDRYISSELFVLAALEDSGVLGRL